MAVTVDLEDLVDDVKAELNVPGTDGYTAATTTEWVNQLRNAFWEANLDGIIIGYTESDGIVSPLSGTTGLSRELQQVIIYYVGVRVVKNTLLGLKTKFAAQAGPVKYETQQSASVLKGLLDEWVHRRAVWLTRLSDIGTVPGYYVDSVIARDNSIGWGDSWWVG